MSMPMPPWDNRWIEEGLLKVRSNYSPIVIFETTDPKRLYQLKDYIRADAELRGTDYVFVYDQWEGLSRLPAAGGASKEAEPYRKPVGNSALARRVEEEGAQLVAFKTVLKEVDGFLKKFRTIFIIQNLSENREAETGLQSALRAWAIDPNIITKGSMIFLVTADANRVCDEFTRELVVIKTVDPSSGAERQTMVEATARELDLKLDAEQVGELVMATAGVNLHQLESILLEGYHVTRRFDLPAIKDLKSALVKRSGVLEVRDPQNGFSDIGGYQVIKDFITRYVIKVLRYSERARRYALPLPKGILFFGPPGTGKSLFANALAREINLPFINLVTENIYSKWLGESGQNLRNAIRLAEKMSPAVVFIDEIDRFGRRGGGGGDSAGEETRRVFSQFLEWLGRHDRQAIIVGTTNVPEHLDEAFTRTGRFDYKIPFLYPGPSARLDILLVHLGLGGGARRVTPPLSVGREELVTFLRERVVPQTEHFSGAELEELVTRAKRLAFDRGSEGLGQEDFLKAARTFRIDRERRLEIVEECLEQARRFTDDQVFLDAIEKEMVVSK
jgi:ATP-dependent 26S proteasome regulatory subunit